MRQIFDVRTEHRLQVADVTGGAEAAFPRGYDGVCTVFSIHMTTGVCVNGTESRLLSDTESMFTGVAPGDGWDYDELDGNANSCLHALLIGSGVSIPAADDALDLGRWQSVPLMECDGPYTRTVAVAAP